VNVAVPPDSVVGPDIAETEMPATSSSLMVTVAALGEATVYATFEASVTITVSAASATESFTGVTTMSADADPPGSSRTSRSTRSRCRTWPSAHGEIDRERGDRGPGPGDGKPPRVRSGSAAVASLAVIVTSGSLSLFVTATSATDAAVNRVVERIRARGIQGLDRVTTGPSVFASLTR